MLSGLLFLTCKAKKYTVQDYEGEYIEFGNSGGFTGAIDCYRLFENGQLFKSSDGENFTEIEEFEKKLTEQMFNNFSMLGMNEMRANDPGNMTFFVSKGQGKRVQTIKWGGTAVEIDPGVRQYYTTLIKLAKRNSGLKK